MGVCPQHDVLFNFLTVEEHLNVFYEFKGGPKADKKQDIENLIENLDL